MQAGIVSKCVFVDANIHIYSYTHAYSRDWYFLNTNIYICICACVSVHIHASSWVLITKNTHIHIHTHIHIRAHGNAGKYFILLHFKTRVRHPTWQDLQQTWFATNLRVPDGTEALGLDCSNHHLRLGNCVWVCHLCYVQPLSSRVHWLDILHMHVPETVASGRDLLRPPLQTTIIWIWPLQIFCPASCPAQASGIRNCPCKCSRLSSLHWPCQSRCPCFPDGMSIHTRTVQHL